MVKRNRPVNRYFADILDAAQFGHLRKSSIGIIQCPVLVVISWYRNTVDAVHYLRIMILQMRG